MYICRRMYICRPAPSVIIHQRSASPTAQTPYASSPSLAELQEHHPSKSASRIQWNAQVREASLRGERAVPPSLPSPVGDAHLIDSGVLFDRLADQLGCGFVLFDTLTSGSVLHETEQLQIQHIGYCLIDCYRAALLLFFSCKSSVRVPLL